MGEFLRSYVFNTSEGSEWYILNFNEVLIAYNNGLKLYAIYEDGHEEFLPSEGFIKEAVKKNISIGISIEDWRNYALQNLETIETQKQGSNFKKLSLKASRFAYNVLLEALEATRSNSCLINKGENLFSGRLFCNSVNKITPFQSLILTLTITGTNSVLDSPFFLTTRQICDYNLNLLESVTEKNAIYFSTHKDVYESLLIKGEKLSAKEYFSLSKEERLNYVYRQENSIITLYNASLTDIKEHPDILAKEDDSLIDFSKVESNFCAFLEQVDSFYLQIKPSPVLFSYFDKDKETIYLLDKSYFSRFSLYVSTALYTIISSIRQNQIEALNSIESKYNPFSWYESLVIELSKAKIMADYSFPSRINPKNSKNVRIWIQELNLNPSLMDILEKDINFIIDFIQKIKDEDVTRLSPYRPPRLNTEDRLILQDIIAKGGYDLNIDDFPLEHILEDFINKFPLLYKVASAANKKINEVALIKKQLNNISVKETDSLIYTNLLKKKGDCLSSAKIYAQRALSLATRELLSGSEDLNPFTIIDDYIYSLFRPKQNRFLVVHNRDFSIVDVVLPGNARQGGTVVYQDERLPFYFTPEEVVLEEEIKKGNATVEKNDQPADKKNKTFISSLLKTRCKAKCVRFFEYDGILGYHPSDRYFKDKEAFIATVSEENFIKELSLDLSPSLTKFFLRAQLFIEDTPIFFIKPFGEKSIAVEPTMEDFLTLAKDIRSCSITQSYTQFQNLANKYYQQVKEGKLEELKFFDFANCSTIDFSKIKNSYFLFNEQNQILCYIEIKGQSNPEPRLIDKRWWMKVFLSDDIKDYTLSLAGFIFKDLLIKEAGSEILKENHPETLPVLNLWLQNKKNLSKKCLQLYERELVYEAYFDDAEKIMSYSLLQVNFKEDKTRVDLFGKPIKVVSFLKSTLSSVISNLPSNQFSFTIIKYSDTIRRKEFTSFSITSFMENVAKMCESLSKSITILKSFLERDISDIELSTQEAEVLNAFLTSFSLDEFKGIELARELILLTLKTIKDCPFKGNISFLISKLLNLPIENISITNPSFRRGIRREKETVNNTLMFLHQKQIISKEELSLLGKSYLLIFSKEYSSIYKRYFFKIPQERTSLFIEDIPEEENLKTLKIKSLLKAINLLRKSSQTKEISSKAARLRVVYNSPEDVKIFSGEAIRIKNLSSRRAIIYLYGELSSQWENEMRLQILMDEFPPQENTIKGFDNDKLAFITKRLNLLRKSDIFNKYTRFMPQEIRILINEDNLVDIFLDDITLASKLSFNETYIYLYARSNNMMEVLQLLSDSKRR